MPLEFIGAGIMDPRKSALRFAGYLPGRKGPIIICEVTTEALRYLGKVTETTDEALMSVFDAHKDTIRALASASFDQGAHRPKVSLSDVVKQSRGSRNA